ncbi:DUF1688-domain-containing protein [Mycena alexandri]|uniref:DUF1688-domain-containing protein n=1 Tax=Mycena alexandri TaxID=1745969 RepID=A0AAD6SJS9_9AGAR|nr:DUF1688-domain-containing protein [Mycena alexandri]
MSPPPSTDNPQTPEDSAAWLRTLPAIRERCNAVFSLAKQDKLQYFEYHPENEEKVAQFCKKIVHREYGKEYDKIPPHGRWRHSEVHHPRVEPLRSLWSNSPSPPDDEEVAARLVDLFTVSVLLDAGAGSTWSYVEPALAPICTPEQAGGKFARSEGLAVAAVHMFAAGLFSGGAEHKVTADGLSQLSAAALAAGLQVTPENPLIGLEGRAALLTRLADALRANPEFFPGGRPGSLVAYLSTKRRLKLGTREIDVPMQALWNALITGLQPIWPPRESLAGVELGDVWTCPALGAAAGDLSLKGHPSSHGLVPFHKLTGWLSYSLREPLERILNWKIRDGDLQTGLPEYRNGGLFLDLGVLALRPTPLSLPNAPAKELPRNPQSGLPRVEPGHPAIVEWRAMTVVLLDRTLLALRTALPAPNLTLAQALESATWAGGRAIAAELRPAKIDADGEVLKSGGGPPIELVSDGTVF